jgi:MiaB-like tRNA modifying enzyme, archaeal-type
MQKYYIETFGCTYNEADSQFIASSLDSLEYIETKDPKQADLIIINTCAVRKESENKAIEAIQRLTRVKKDQKTKLIVTGCMVKLNPYRLINLEKNAIYVSPSRIIEIPKIVTKENLDTNIIIGPSDRNYHVIPKHRGEISYSLPISSGCLGSCSFCSVKFTRGKLYSYPPSLIKKAFIDALLGGAKEIYLTSQDTAVYGLDINTNLCELIKGLLEIELEFRLRIGMFTPWFAFRILNELIEIYKDRRVYKFCHVPVQSGDDKVLKNMLRPHTVAEFEDFIKNIRLHYPNIFIATDIIVGFPTEDDEAFENTLKLMERIKFDKVHIAQYSPRPFTKAASLRQLPDSVKKERSRIATKLADEISYKINQKFIGKCLEVLVVGESEKNQLEGRANDYRCVIIESKNKDLIGKFINVEVIEATPHYLRSKPID